MRSCPSALRPRSRQGRAPVPGTSVPSARSDGKASRIFPSHHFSFSGRNPDMPSSGGAPGTVPAEFTLTPAALPASRDLASRFPGPVFPPVPAQLPHEAHLPQQLPDLCDRQVKKTAAASPQAISTIKTISRGFIPYLFRTAWRSGGKRMPPPRRRRTAIRRSRLPTDGPAHA